MTHHQYGISALVPQQGSTQDSSLEWVHHLGMRDKEYEYEEEGFCLGNIIGISALAPEQGRIHDSS